ncbi:MAG TPA: DUF4199 domain-containing protein [Edaphocola sp.]|nr:DUF4199 domain-containing protein [Edaphocola sp.]
MSLEKEQNTFDIIPEKPSTFALGLKMGIITALVYIILLLLRYMFLSYNPMIFTGSVIISYIIILVFYGMTVWQRRKDLGGYAEIRDLFGAVFICILITEIVYCAFNYIYLNFIDPGFFTRFEQSTIEYIKKVGGDSMKVQQQIDKFKGQKGASGSVLSTIIGLGQWLIIDSILGLLISLAFRKVKPQY